MIIWTEIFEIYFHFLNKYVEFYCKIRNITVLLVLKLWLFGQKSLKSTFVFSIITLNFNVKYVILLWFWFKVLLIWTEIFEIYFRFLNKYVEFYCKIRNTTVLLILKFWLFGEKSLKSSFVFSISTLHFTVNYVILPCFWF